MMPFQNLSLYVRAYICIYVFTLLLLWYYKVYHFSPKNPQKDQKNTLGFGKNNHTNARYRYGSMNLEAGVFTCNLPTTIHVKGKL